MPRQTNSQKSNKNRQMNNQDRKSKSLGKNGENITKWIGLGRMNAPPEVRRRSTGHVVAVHKCTTRGVETVQWSCGCGVQMHHDTRRWSTVYVKRLRIIHVYFEIPSISKKYIKGLTIKFPIWRPSHSGTARHSWRYDHKVIVYKLARAQLSAMRRIASQLS